MPGADYRAACKAICTWLLTMNADTDLPDFPEKCPLMLAAGSGIADIFQFLLRARASVEAPAGPSLDAVLAVAFKMKGDRDRVLDCLA